MSVLTDVPNGYLTPMGLRWVIQGSLLAGPAADAKHVPVPTFACLYLSQQPFPSEVADRARPYFHLPIYDCEPAPDDLLSRSLAFRQQTAGQPLLVCCQAGISRSVSVCYGILRVTRGWSHEQALRACAAGTALGIDPIDEPGNMVSPRTQPLGSIRAQVDRLLAPAPAMETR